MLCLWSCGGFWSVCEVVVVPYDDVVDAVTACTLVCGACVSAERV